MSLGLQEAVPGRPAKQRFWGEPALWGLALACLGAPSGPQLCWFDGRTAQPHTGPRWAAVPVLTAPEALTQP